MNASRDQFSSRCTNDSMNHTKSIKFVLPLVTALVFLVTWAHAAAPKVKVLIIDGQNNHKWAETTPYLKAILEEAGVFTVNVSTAPPSKPDRKSVVGGK